MPHQADGVNELLLYVAVVVRCMSYALLALSSAWWTFGSENSILIQKQHAIAYRRIYKHSRTFLQYRLNTIQYNTSSGEHCAKLPQTVINPTQAYGQTPEPNCDKPRLQTKLS